MNNKYPHLIEITSLDDSEPTYVKEPGVLDSDLTGAERAVLERSRRYLEMRRALKSCEICPIFQKKNE